MNQLDSRSQITNDQLLKNSFKNRQFKNYLTLKPKWIQPKKFLKPSLTVYAESDLDVLPTYE